MLATFRVEKGAISKPQGRDKLHRKTKAETSANVVNRDGWRSICLFYSIQILKNIFSFEIDRKIEGREIKAPDP